MRTIQFLGVLTISVLIIGCSGNSNQKKNKELAEDLEVENLSEMMANMPMPASIEVIDLLNKSGAGYIFDATNPPDRVENYISYKQKAINLGIYAADLVYTTTYQKKDETALYLDNFVQLVGALEISTLDRVFFQRVQNNLDNKDSLLIIVNEAQISTHKFLNETGKTEMALFALTGSWVEGMYLVGASIKFAVDKQPIFNIIAKQQKPLNELITLMNAYKTDENFSDLYLSLTQINDLMVKFINTPDITTVEPLNNKIIEFRNSLN